jgi:hypothetical protein
LVDRGLWFNPGIFQSPTLAKKLKKIAGYDRLDYVSVSLIIARGTKASMKFDSAVDTTQWTKQAFQASGGVSIFGYRFGGSGSSTSYDYSLDTAADGKTVTFKDDPLLARLLAVRLERFTPVDETPGIAEVDQPINKLRRGEIDYLTYQKSKF